MAKTQFKWYAAINLARGKGQLQAPLAW